MLRINKSLLESPVKASFSFNMPQHHHHQHPSSSFNPLPSGLREEQWEGGHTLDSSSSTSSHDLLALSTLGSTMLTSTTSSNSNHGLNAPELVYNPCRASTIQGQIELVQQETEELHHAFLHSGSRSASLASNFSPALLLLKRMAVPPALHHGLAEQDEDEEEQNNDRNEV